ncbi:hypothetical protein Y1Q_0017927 [Alligator mississippiensis]|uniref:Uncharacterized protein n=1 Tax=Alligator mississippiensis TaxID=8496 RepID=A0A151MXV5_ALLMI|nr:hypothetical protein Y1Q_0017927 [Alligator mississippiensis]
MMKQEPLQTALVLIYYQAEDGQSRQILNTENALALLKKELACKHLKRRNQQNELKNSRTFLLPSLPLPGSCRELRK